ncbi:MAG: hypothetical protein JWM28_1256 [Chitinophagaceae bacterium]|nr:hypothetical protein [Chitinophagaceae bacterium]
MKYSVFLFLFLYSVVTAKGQNHEKENDKDSLSKYSYNISGAYSDSINTINFTGTGFFINIHGKAVFVTASHVLSRCKEKGEEKKYFPDTMNIFLNDENGHFTRELIPVNVMAFRDTGVCPAIKYPDIGTYQVPDSFKSKVFSIEEMMENDITKISGTINIFGFPISRNIEPPGYTVSKSTPLKIEKYEMLDSFYFINSHGELESDSTNYILIPTGMVIDSTLKGYSGSPVFEFNESHWRFIGLLMGANTTRKYLVIVKPQYLREKLLSY